MGFDVVREAAPVVEIQAASLEVVARAKADALMGRVAPPFFVEDAGLFVDALGGFPGVYSAYAYDSIGNEGILRLLGKDRRRGAAFRAVLVLVESPGRSHEFVGDVRGTIATRARGSAGFGFDPIFVPQGVKRTFAEQAPPEKSRHSHRGRALAKLARYLTRTGRPR